MNMLDVLKMPTVTGRNGIHIAAQLEVDGASIDHVAYWAGDTMRKAAEHIRCLEDLLTKEQDDATASNEAEATGEPLYQHEVGGEGG